MTLHPMFSCSFHWLCDKTPAYLTGSYIFSTEKSCAASQISQHFCPRDAITMAARHHLPLLIRNVPSSQNTDSKGLTRSGVRHTKFWYLNIFVMDMLSGSFFAVMEMFVFAKLSVGLCESCSYLTEMQCCDIITWSFFSQILTVDTP